MAYARRLGGLQGPLKVYLRTQGGRCRYKVVSQDVPQKPTSGSHPHNFTALTKIETALSLNSLRYFDYLCSRSHSQGAFLFHLRDLLFAKRNLLMLDTCRGKG